MTAARIRRAAVLAGLCAAFLATSAYVVYTGLRVRLVRDSIAARADGVRLPIESGKISGLVPPFAVIATVRNDSASAASISIRIDDQDVCAPVVAAGRAMRVDCQFSGTWNPASDHSIALTSPASSWRVDALEVSKHHGSNASVIRLFVLPAASRQYQAPGVFACVVAWLSITALLLLPRPELPKAVQIAHRAVVGLFVLWAAAVVLAPFVSRYRVIVSLSTVLGWIALCLAPQIYGVLQKIWGSPVFWSFVRSATVRSLAVACAAAFCFAAVTERRIAVQYDGNRSGLLLLARARIEANPWLEGRDDVKRGLKLLDNQGYDGQFMYAIAFDPLLQRFRNEPRAYQPFIDAPPYRYGRVGYPALARTVALAQPERFPAALIGLIYAGAFLTAFASALVARRFGVSELWGFLAALVPGFWASFATGLPEPLAAGAVVAGYLCVRQERWVAGALLLAVACLIRETAAFFVVCIAGWLALSRQPRLAIKLLVLALGPLALWRLYVGWVFEPGWGMEAFWTTPDDFGAPFAGIAGLWSDLSAGRYHPDLWEMRRGILLYSLLVLAAVSLSWIMLRVKPGAVTAAASLFGIMAICFNLHGVWVSTGNAERLSSDLFLMLALATPEFVSRSKPWRISLLLFWGATALYLLFGTFDASFTRHALIDTVWH